MSVLVTTAVVLLLLFTTAFVYDRVARLKRAVQKTWRQLEDQRRIRHAVVERIVTACRARPSSMASAMPRPASATGTSSQIGSRGATV